MSNFSFGLFIAIVGTCCLASCKTVREVTHIESKGISDPLSDRFIGSSVSKYESGTRHSMDSQRTTTKKIFGGKHNNSMFGGTYDKKKFQGNKKSSLTDDQFNSGNYYFAKKRSLSRKTSNLSDDQYSLSQKKANEGAKNWFGQSKGFKKTGFLGAKKKITRKPLKAALDAQEKNRNTDLEIISSPGIERSPQGMSIDDVRKLLGN
ncbi:MAG: hypothetical protein HN584_11500 [Akkermansiaceae bacterium]|nr:hypothetical protein [Akkermansiaceae bacterium]MDG1853319.1 hypothetical protein [Verrucomicrobiales bacterium]